MKIYKNENGELVIDGEGKVTVDISSEKSADAEIKYDKETVGVPVILGVHFTNKTHSSLLIAFAG